LLLPRLCRIDIRTAQKLSPRPSAPDLMFKVLLAIFEPSLALKYSKWMTANELPFSSPSSDEHCIANIK
jgi:hypothetical protein